ncbi:origin recognition complex subunit 4 [Exophiala viscosa]|uniref:Origin recognition complex subunit 4 n=1 Tax=Exophiala viscosa TaxID=2486360 RepID=A0AAN6IIE3_9EURO|nr:origin recognition complex subunit 4 [Exophiala viscosa]
MTQLYSKATHARCLLRMKPGDWLGEGPIEKRDKDLLDAESVSFLDYNRGSYLRKIYHMKAGEKFDMTNWTVENDETCKELVRSAGGHLYGYGITTSPAIHWASVTVNVNISGTPGSGFNWGYLSTRPANIRIFKGPAHTCALHPWDAMILRDCTPNTDNLSNIKSIESRKWDILCMKMCEDYDYPWVVVAVKDAGTAPEPGAGSLYEARVEVTLLTLLAYMDAFEPPSKRRRTGTYATRRRTVNTADEEDTTLGVAQNSTENRNTAAEQAVRFGEDTTDRREDTEAAKTASRSSSIRKRRPTDRALETSADATSTTNNGRQPRKSAKANETGNVEKALESAAAPEVIDEAGDDEEDEHEDTTQQRRSSGRARRAPRRFSPDPELLEKPSQPQTKPSQKSQPKPRQTKNVSEDNGAVAPSPQPKGILTPSRHGRAKNTSPRKSVVFDADEQQIEEQLGFKDINTSSKSKSKGKEPKDTNKPPDSPSKGSLPQRQVGSKDNKAGTGLLLDDIHDEDDEIEIEPAPDVDDILSWNNTKTTVTDGNQETSQPEQEDAHITKIKTEIISRITNQSLPAISNLQTQYDTLHSLLEATVAAGESNSLLLLGSRGSGKSLLISHALADLSRSHGDDFHIVRLNGFFQTDDKLALREIWRQLGREMAVSEDETGEVTSYADTMASLLSLLSHPEEFTDPNAMMLDNVDQNEEVNKTAKSVIFVLDEFDLFTTHPRQTLLYNLFDIAQARKAPIAVIGCSTRMDVVDCLEKRVKSRFSHRWLHLPSMKILKAFEDAVVNTLVMPIDGKEALGVTKDDLEWRQRWNTAIKTQLLSQTNIQDLLKKTFYSTKSIPDVLAALYIPIATLSVSDESDGRTTANDNDANAGMVRMTTMSNSSPSLFTVLPQLPTLHLSLLIAAARLETIHNFEAANFALVYNHYVELLKRSRLQRSSLSARSQGAALTGAGFRQWSKSTATGAWEDLAQWEMIVPVSRSVAAGGGSKFGEDTLGGDSIGVRMFRVDVALDEIAWAVRERLGAAGAGEVLTKWCNEV